MREVREKRERTIASAATRGSESYGKEGEKERIKIEEKKT